MRDDGVVLTEFGRIAVRLARTNLGPASRPTTWTRRRTTPIMDKTVGMVRQSLGLGQESIRKQGRERVERAFAILDEQMAGRSFADAEHFGIADTALFYVECWAPEVDIELPANLAAHLDRVRRRPAVERVMRILGEN